MRHWSLVGFACFFLSVGSQTADAKKKLQIDRAEGPVDQSVFERGLVTEDVKARDILQARLSIAFSLCCPPPPAQPGHV